jgi:hypothetical protein
MIPEHSDSTVEIKLEYVTDAEVAALFKVYAIKEANVNGKKED